MTTYVLYLTHLKAELYVKIPEPLGRFPLLCVFRHLITSEYTEAVEFLE